MKHWPWIFAIKYIIHHYRSDINFESLLFSTGSHPLIIFQKFFVSKSFSHRIRRCTQQQITALKQSADDQQFEAKQCLQVKILAIHSEDRTNEDNFELSCQSLYFLDLLFVPLIYKDQNFPSALVIETTSRVVVWDHKNEALQSKWSF